MAKIQSASSIAGKETIYVDVDDEITSIIDKVGSAKSKVIALVLPKRATVLQSIVNMKLLKRTADTAGKNLVLVTSEAGLMPLAGSVGLFVASTPTSKPAIPAAPEGPSDEPEDINEPLDIADGTAEDPEEFDTTAAAGKTVGELAAAGAASKIAADDIDESIDMSDEADEAATAAAVASPISKSKKNKKLKIPNFDSFRKKAALAAVAVVLLVAAWIFAATVLPHATITIHTDSSTIPTNLNLSLDTAAKSLNTANNTVPATSQSQQKTATQTVPATGQQNNGQKAAGSVTMTGQECAPNLGQPSDVPVGTTISTGGLTYVTQETTHFSPLGSGHGSCQTYQATGAIDVTALKPGTAYNVSGAKFTVTQRPDVTGSGSASGGTDDITKVVAQSDIDGATAKIKATDTTSVKQQLTSGLQSKGLQAIATTFVAGNPQVTTSAKAGDATDTVTVTAVTTYTMLGVNKDDLKTLVVKNVDGQLDKGKQVILDDGVANAKFTELNSATATSASVAMEAKSLAGPQLDATQLKTQLAGKKSADVKSFISQTPGVSSVDVKYGPFWVNSVPHKAGKVTITIVKAGQ